MLRLPCPYCGPRDESEFRYRGDASRAALAGASAGDATAVARDLYERRNPLGWHAEWWQHVAGCRAVLRVIRHTHTHAIHSVTLPTEPLAWPQEPR